MEATARVGLGRTLELWKPEDHVFWESQGKTIANVNLWISIPALFLAFAIWQVWSVVAVTLSSAGFTYSADQLFWLAAAPALSGATLRMFYAFIVPLIGGRRWTAISTATLLAPALGIGLAVQHPGTPYTTMLALALLCGLGGGNFSSSMANISFFFPKSSKGVALGLNAGLGNLGVSAVQLLSPLAVSASVFGMLGGGPQIIATAGRSFEVWTQNAAFIWVPWIALTAVAAWFGMNDLSTARSSLAGQLAILRQKHTWLMCVLYLGAFGSFIGYSAGFPLLIKMEFPSLDPLAYAWLGPFIGAVARPLGGWLADRLGGARVSLWTFGVMALAVIGVLSFLPAGGRTGSFAGFFASFLALFLASGIANGSTFRMIPVIFQTLKMRQIQRADQTSLERAAREANTESAAALGFTGAIAAYGGFFIPKGYGTSIALTGGPVAALCAFVAFYLVCIGVTWWYYARRSAPLPC